MMVKKISRYHVEKAQRIKDVTCDICGVRAMDMLGPKREARLVTARHLAMYLVRTQTGLSYPQIGRLFKRDHSSVLYALNSIQRRLEKQLYVERLLSKIKIELGVK